MAGIHFDWDKSEDFSRFRTKANQASRKVDNEALFQMYEARFRAYMQELFDTQGQHMDPPWADISEEWKARKGFDTIGIWKDRMHQSLTGGKGYYSRITKTTVEMGQRAGAAPHTKYFRNGKKPRKIELTEREQKLWRNMAQLYYENTVRNALDPNAKRKSIRMPTGQLFTVDKDGTARIRSGGGQFLSKVAQGLGMKRMGGGGKRLRGRR